MCHGMHHFKAICVHAMKHPSACEFTKGGNMKAPSRSLLCEWVKGAWEAVPVE